MPSVSSQLSAAAQTSVGMTAARSGKHLSGAWGRLVLLLVWTACLWTAAGCATVPPATRGKVDTVQGWMELERPGL